MGTSWVTVCAVAGRSATPIRKMFNLAHKTEDFAAVDRLFAGLKVNATEPPVVFFQQYIDGWSVAASALSFVVGDLGRSAKRFDSDAAAYAVIAASGPVRRKPKWDPESLWLQDAVRNARSACVIHRQAVVLVEWRTVRPSQLDDEKRAAAKFVPDWIASLT